MPIMNASSFEGPVDPAILHPRSMHVTESWGVVKQGGEGSQAFNYQVQLVVTAKGTWIACWTQGDHESAPDQRVVVSRSTDGGRTWGEEIVVEPPGADNHVPAWIMLYYVPPTGRVYAFFWWNTDGTPLRDAGDLYFRYSDDDGLTWSDRCPMDIPKTAMDNGTATHGWNFGQPRLLAASGTVILTYNKIRQSSMLFPGYRITSERRWEKVDPHAEDVPFERLIGSRDPDRWHTEVFFCELTNILTESDPNRLRFRWLPEGDEGLWVEHPTYGQHCGQEGTLVSLSGGRLLCMMRTRQGHPYYSVSADGGATWSRPEMLRYSPGGEPVWQPCAPCPFHKLPDGRFVLLFHNARPYDIKHRGWYPRDPMWVTIAREAAGVEQNAGLYFTAPKVVLYNDRVPGGPFKDTEICYPQLYQFGDHCYIAYANKTSEIRINRVPPELIDDAGLPV